MADTLSDDIHQINLTLRRVSPMPLSPSELSKWLEITPYKVRKALRQMELEGAVTNLQNGYWRLTAAAPTDRTERP